MVAPDPAGAPSCLPRPALTYRHFCRGCLRLFIVFAHLLHIGYLTGVGLHWSISWLFGEGLRFGFFWTFAFLQKHFKNEGNLTGLRLNLYCSISPRTHWRLIWTVSQCAPRMRGQAHVWNGEWLHECRCSTASAGHLQGSPNHVAAAVPVQQPGDFSPCSWPWPKCLSMFKLYHLQTVIAVCKRSVCCCTDLFLSYFNTAMALNRCQVHSKAPAGIMDTARSGPSSLQALTLCPPTLYWGFWGFISSLS